ncbi:MAG: hypothetical protein D6744_12730 [Planctomycetota bacterium]|nr:MAG: hypothetical protein D6744_12730 [Planctomycetota bacterium]
MRGKQPDRPSATKSRARGGANRESARQPTGAGDRRKSSQVRAKEMATMLSGRRGTVLALFGAGLLASVVQAAETRLFAEGVASPQSAFSLIFDGYQTDAVITHTEYTLVLDPLAGTATFQEYYQEAGSLLLPTGVPGQFVNTGDLTIEIVPNTSSGWFDPATGDFETNDLYAVYFTGDLSVFGITSPFVLPGVSRGNVNDTSGDYSAGEIAMIWDGEGSLPPDAPPEQSVPFVYQCTVNAEYAVTNGCAAGGGPCLGDVSRDCTIDLSDLGIVLENFGRDDFLTTPRRGDVDGDVDVDLSDLAILLSRFAGGC